MTFINRIARSIDKLDREVNGIKYHFQTSSQTEDSGSLYKYPMVEDNIIEYAKFKLVNIGNNEEDITLNLTAYKNSTFDNTILTLEHIDGLNYQFVSSNRAVIIPFELKE